MSSVPGSGSAARRTTATSSQAIATRDPLRVSQLTGLSCLGAWGSRFGLESTGAARRTSRSSSGVTPDDDRRIRVPASRAGWCRPPRFRRRRSSTSPVRPRAGPAAPCRCSRRGCRIGCRRGRVGVHRHGRAAVRWQVDDLHDRRGPRRRRRRVGQRRQPDASGRGRRVGDEHERLRAARSAALAVGEHPARRGGRRPGGVVRSVQKAGVTAGPGNHIERSTTIGTRAT